MRPLIPVSFVLTVTLSLLAPPAATAGAAVMADHIAGGMPGDAVLIDDTDLLSQPQPLTDVRYAPQEPYPVVSNDAYHTGAAYSTGTSLEAKQAWLSGAVFVIMSDDPFHTGAAYSTGTSDQASDAWLVPGRAPSAPAEAIPPAVWESESSVTGLTP